MRNKRRFYTGDVISLDSHWNIQIISAHVGRDGRVLGYFANAGYLNMENKELSDIELKKEIARMIYMLPPNVVVVDAKVYTEPLGIYNDKGEIKNGKD
jgi:hypothetical protein